MQTPEGRDHARNPWERPDDEPTQPVWGARPDATVPPAPQQPAQSAASGDPQGMQHTTPLNNTPSNATQWNTPPRDTSPYGWQQSSGWQAPAGSAWQQSANGWQQPNGWRPPTQGAWQNPDPVWGEQHGQSGWTPYGATPAWGPPNANSPWATSGGAGLPPWSPPTGFPVGHPDGPWPGWQPPGYLPTRPKRRRGTAASLFAALVVVFALLVAYLGQGSAQVTINPARTLPPSAPVATNPDNTSRTTNAAALTAGVVLIDTTLSGGGASGTGMILSSDGKILTNYHVVEKSTSITVTVADSGAKYTATVVGYDKSRDVALLQLAKASGLPTVKLDKDGVAIGAKVTAVGNAGGKGSLVTVTGMVTALRQTISVGDEFTNIGHDLKGLIQTTAPVEPGDSGGPMYDSQGEVLGMTTAGSLNGRSSGNVQTYAVPIADALKVVAQIESGVETPTTRIGRPAFLGLSLSLPSRSGSATTTPSATVTSVVPGGPAATAGITVGSTITSIGSSKIATTADVSDALGSLNPGDKVTVTWTSGGREYSATVTLGTSPTN